MTAAADRRDRPRRRRWSWRLLLPACAALLAFLVALDPGAGADGEGGAIRAEDVATVVDLLAAIRERFADGRVLKLDLERETRDSVPVWIYEAKILMPDGDVFEVEYDARSLEVLDLQGPEED